ncbi:conserved hypothetical protein [uncultured Mycobacterium sp.]|uniref:DUF3987 domain-containing protein n=1 Tax=uncultured Mycobacterium sp. TaxID=171292 RepID=A0A1Y5PKG5_9MYCO|nr:conserved hypothetical protein [uncultured Mycobacterium sp.]
MTDLTNEFFLESDSEQLRKIHQWARARYAAPWAVFFSVLLRVAASVGPHVRLPGVIGGHASLNLMVAFVSASGGGKGISDKVGRLAWPESIVELPIGSGEGIAETYMLRGKETEDTERVTRAIFNCSEIDILTGLESRQGSTILGTLKAFAMGEQLGSTNASKANSRNVPAHSYRGCLSVGAQPGHTGVIFNDTTGGTPQRFLWALTIDPDMPADRAADPGPLDTRMPSWEPIDGTVEIVYGHDQITETIIAAHLARQRGEADALDGHAMLTRCKVAALLAIMHGRSVVSEWDWQQSDTVMAVSDSTREWILEEARKTARAKVRDRAIGKATFDEIIDERHGRTVRSRILRLLATGPMSRSELRRAMGKQHYREAFDAVLPHLEKVCQVVTVPGDKAMHYALNPEFTGEPEFTPENSRSGGVNREFTGEPRSNITELDSRRSHDSPPQTAAAWLSEWIAANADSDGWVKPADALAAGESAGHNRAAIIKARQVYADPPIESSGLGRRSMWRIAPTIDQPEETA